MTKTFTRVILTVVLLMAAQPTVSVLAAEQEPTPSMDEINEVAKDLFCPVCENNPLDQCGSQACIDMRDEISILLQEGKTEAEIQEYFINYHGDRVVSAPPAEGLNLLLYVLPPLLILLVGFFLLRAMRSWIASPETAGVEDAKPEPPKDEYISEIEKQLKDRQND